MTNVTSLETPESVFRTALASGESATDAMLHVAEKFPKMTEARFDAFVEQQITHLRQEAEECFAEAKRYKDESARRKATP